MTKIIIVGIATHALSTTLREVLETKGVEAVIIEEKLSEAKKTLDKITDDYAMQIKNYSLPEPMFIPKEFPRNKFFDKPKNNFKRR